MLAPLGTSRSSLQLIQAVLDGPGLSRQWSLQVGPRLWLKLLCRYLRGHERSQVRRSWRRDSIGVRQWGWIGWIAPSPSKGLIEERLEAHPPGGDLARDAGGLRGSSDDGGDAPSLWMPSPVSRRSATAAQRVALIWPVADSPESCAFSAISHEPKNGKGVEGV
jgi:hypothetical protein